MRESDAKLSWPATDTHGRASAASSPPSPPRITVPVEFYTVELASLEDGTVFVGLTATSFDEEESQLLNQEIAAERAATTENVSANDMCLAAVRSKRYCSTLR
jgi:hypothetical protein